MARWNKPVVEVPVSAAPSEVDMIATEPLNGVIAEILSAFAVSVSVGDKTIVAAYPPNRQPRPKVGDVVKLDGDRVAK